MTKRHWTGSYGSIPAEIDPDRFPSVSALLDDAMRRFADRPAFHSYGRTLTYGDVDRLSTALAAYLQQVVGVRKGDRVAVMLPNVLAFAVAFVAVAKIGAIQVNVNPLYTAREPSISSTTRASRSRWCAAGRWARSPRWSAARACAPC